MFLCVSLAAQNLLKIHLCGCTDVHLYYNKTGSPYDPAVIPHQCSQQQPSPPLTCLCRRHAGRQVNESLYDEMFKSADAVRNKWTLE